MLTTIKSLKVSYQPVNEKNTFTNGDCVSGAVTLELAKECEMESLMIKFKGKAEVLWTERYGQTTHVYHSKDKYFSIKHYFFGGKDLRGEWADSLRRLMIQHRAASRGSLNLQRKNKI